MTIHLALADNSDLTLIGMQSVLDKYHHVQVVGICQVLSEFLELIASASPDVILISDRIEPDCPILTLIRSIQEAAPQSKVIILGHHPAGLIIPEILNYGVLGYLYRYDRLEECLIEAIQTVMREKPYLSPSASTAYLLSTQLEENYRQLGPEAYTVLRLIAEGHYFQEIALMHQVSVRRVYRIVSKLRRRFGARTSLHLIARAAEEGFLA